VPVCPRCGAESPEGFLHCGFCGAALATSAPERRKLATLLFCDMSGSTAMGERVDAETVRDLMFRYFHEMRGALERHGGTVEKFIGDAVVAVFGVPQAHEDDALRACRAALEMQARLAALNEELERRFGTRIALRIGLNTGEVVAGDATSRETFVTGDAVNVAARLEQVAAPGEVLLGEPTYRLVREAVRVEPVEPLTLKGKSASLPAYRLVEVSGLGPLPRRAGTQLVGREQELALLEREFEAVTAERSSRLVTIVGEAGVGKSRLATEFVARVGPRARVLRGRCLSYGEGITYWAIGEIVREAAGIRDEHSTEEARARIEALLEDVPNGHVVAARMAQLLGIAEGVATAPETAWAIRQFVAAQAGDRPLLLIVDDIHWGEPTLLDLLADLPEGNDDAPILLLCLARPDLLESRPDWEATVRLQPLAETEVESLLGSLLGGAPAGVGAKLLKASAGNPLFVEELVAMLVEEGVLRPEDGSWALERELDSVALPASLNALLGARLDRLEDSVRGVLERGAIEGELFHRGAVAELSLPEARLSVPAQLEILAGKDYVLPAEASFGGEAAFRFRHILIREAAYGATAKKLRAELHERFAGWLERVAGDRVGEYEEILGYHLEQSFRYRSELGPVDDDARVLAGRAVRRLGAAGRRASARGDLDAAISFLMRAVALLPGESRERIELLPELVEALYEAGRLSEAETYSAAGIEAVEAFGDEHLIAVARVQRAWFKAYADPGDGSEWALAEAERAIPVLERAGDDGALARAWEAVFEVNWLRGQLTAARAAAERGLAHAERARDDRQQGRLRIARTASAGFGLVPQDEMAEEMERDLAWARRTGSLWLEALLIQAMGTLQARRGDPQGGEKLIELGMSTIAELGMRIFAAGLVPNWIWHVTDDPVVIEARLRESYSALLEAGDKAMVGSVAASLGEALYRQGRYEEAEEMVRVGEDTAGADDIYLQVLWRAVRAKLLARRELFGEAEGLAREAVALAYESEYVDARSDAQLALGEVLRLAGRTGEAEEALEEARALHEAKGNVLQVERVRTLLAELHSGARSQTAT
jgi:class 3 adenylate cyclase/tetratricopeptide (TPR) repeat protein